MRFVIAMDSFKGSLTSLEAGNAVKNGILSVCPTVEATVLPLADGGEGTIDAVLPFTGGAGMLQALGARFLDKDGNETRRGCSGLKDIVSVDLAGLVCRDVKVTVASDVTNPLCGPDGASFVYPPHQRLF